MGAELLTSTDFYVLDRNFRKIHNLTQYESLMWVDKYDEPGSFEIYAPPTKEIKEAAQIGNYFQSNKSEHLMIIEKLKTTFSPNNGERLIIAGRSLESILDRRVVFTQTYFHNKTDPEDPEEAGADNLEDAIRQLLDATIINPENSDRQIDNFVFEYSHDESISSINMEDMVFDKGENVLNIVQTIIKSEHLGYKITLNDQNEFVFRLIIGIDRTREQNTVPLVEFSPMFNNLKESSFTVDAGENYKNYVFTEGEIYNSQKPLIVETGDATGLDRREIYITSNSTHENESSNLCWDGTRWVFKKESKTLTDTEYEDVLKEEGETSYTSYSTKTEMESEVEPRLQFVYGRDFTIGDIVQIKDKSGNTSKSRVVEFIISHSASGYEEYPTFEDVEEESETPTQSSSTGGEYSEKGKMTNDEIIREAGGGGGEGHVYDLEFTQDLNELNLTEDGSEKTQLHLVPVYVGSEADWNLKSVAEKKQYKFAIFDTPSNNFSHIGQIIESTTLDTEAKVKAVYGASTSWIQHTGYMLRGASSGVVSGSQGQANDGGADSQTVSSVANHNHTQNSHSHKVGRVNIYYGNAGSYGPVGISAASGASDQNGLAIAQTATNNAEGANYTVPTLPKYKNVYIWERIA